MHDLDHEHGAAETSSLCESNLNSTPRLDLGVRIPAFSVGRIVDPPMPRKIRPKYAIDPTQRVQDFSFTDAQIQQLFRALAPVNSDRKEMIATLERCSRDYIWRRNQHQQKPTRAEQNVAVKEIGELAAKLAEKLRNLYMDTEWEISLRIPEFYSDPPKGPITILANRLENIDIAAEQILSASRRKTGPRSLTWVARTVAELANFYEQRSGKRLSHNPKLKTRYVGLPQSPAGKFIVAFFKIIDPGVTPQSISTAMANYVKFRGSK